MSITADFANGELWNIPAKRDFTPSEPSRQGKLQPHDLKIKDHKCIEDDRLACCLFCLTMFKCYVQFYISFWVIWSSNSRSIGPSNITWLDAVARKTCIVAMTSHNSNWKISSVPELLFPRDSSDPRLLAFSSEELSFPRDKHDAEHELLLSPFLQCCCIMR